MNLEHVPVVVVGAGPYGLSLASHLRARRVPHRIFGRPMSTWSERMPRGMYLKSEGFSANLSEPSGRHTLRAYCHRHGLEYGDVGTPVALQSFVDYGRWFQQELVPQLEQQDVVRLERVGDRFRLRLASGEELTADQVVLAVGLSAFAYVPPELADLPAGYVSHTSAHHDLSGFAGRRVVLVGGGQSALENAALLREAGARPQVLVRGPGVIWSERTYPERPLWARVLAPRTALGASWKLKLYLDAPGAFRHLRPERRAEIVRTKLGPSGSWWLRERVLGKVPITCAAALRSLEVDGGQVRLTVECAGARNTVEADHVMAGTGYRVDLARLRFLDPALRAQLAVQLGYPQLSRSFESSVPGLYFVGLSAALTYGPVQRFVAGAGLAARRVSEAVARRAASNARPRAAPTPMPRVPARVSAAPGTPSQRAADARVPQAARRAARAEAEAQDPARG